MDNVVEQLRDGCVLHPRRWSGDTHADLGGTINEAASDAVMAKAADEIERLQAENARLRALITAWADADEADHAALGMEMGTHQSCECTPWCALRKAVGR